MDLVIIIVAVIVFFLIIGLIFRLIKYTLKIVSVVILILLILIIAGSFIQIQAFFLPSNNQAFLTITDDFTIAVRQTGNSNVSYIYDPSITTAFQKEWLTYQNNGEFGSYSALKKFASTNQFDQMDTVWLIDARNNSNCQIAKIQKNANDYAAHCLPPRILYMSWDLVFDPTLQGKILHKIPLKADLWQWTKNNLFTQNTATKLTSKVSNTVESAKNISI